MRPIVSGSRRRGGDAAVGVYERFRPTYTLPYTETDAPFTYNANTGLTEGTVWDTSWHTRAWWQANAVTVRTVKASGGDYTAAQFATALSDAATANDIRVIVVDAGLTITGHFTVPAKSGTAQRTLVCSSTWWAGTWAPTGQRYVDVDTETAQMFTIQGTVGNENVFNFASAGASNWAFVGAIIRRFNNTVTCFNVITIATASATTIADLPHSHLFQWCWIDGIAHNGTAVVPTRRGVQADGYKSAFLNSALTGFSYSGSDSQPLSVFSGAGRIKVVDCLLEAAAEGFIAGGAEPNANWLPADMEFRRVYFVKRQQWNTASSLFYGGSPISKNCYEIKHGLRVLCEACVFENSWAQGQVGEGIVLKTTNQSNTTRRVESKDITFLHCIVKNVGCPFLFSMVEYGGGGPSYNGANTFALNRVEVINVLGISDTAARINNGFRSAISFGTGTGGENYSGSRGPYRFRWYTAASRENTGFSNTMRMLASLDTAGLIENSLFDYGGAFGITSSNNGVWNDAGALTNANVSVRKNALAESPAWLRRSNFISPFPEQADTALWSTCPTTPSPRSEPSNWFANRGTGNFRPHPSATYKGLADGGFDPGADIDFIESVTAGVADAPSFITVEFV